MHKNRILSPMGTGNGAYVVHKLLESRIPNYQVIPYNPYRTFFPPSLFSLGRFSHADLIHTTPNYGFFHVRKKVPLILTFHGYVLDRFMTDYSGPLQNIHSQTDLKIFTKLALGHADTITSVSQFIADLVKRDLNLAVDVKVIYNGVDHTLFTPRKQNQNRSTNRINVLYCGKLTRRKGATLLAPIAGRLGHNINIVYTSGLQPTGMSLHHPQLQCLGSIPYNKMPSVYQDADILLFPTVREGFGLAAAEAMACGLPVVATNCSSLPELVDDGRGGFLCPLGDIDAFVDKIRHLAENPQLRREMGDYNRTKVEKMFTLDRMVAEYQKLFEEVLSS